jgi:hypothetical protein
MLTVVLDLELTGVKGLATSQTPTPSDPASDLFRSLALWWSRNVAQPYLALPAARRGRPATIEWPFLGRIITLNTTFDLDLLAQSLEIYARCGWNALEAIASALEGRQGVSGETRDFFRLTQNVVAVMIARALVEIEQQCLLYARAEWAADRRQLLSYLREFKSTKGAGGSVGFKDARVIDPLFEQCKKYKAAYDEAMALGRKMEDRIAKTPAKARPSGSAFEKWFELYAAPQREVLARMAGIMKDIAKTFAPAVLVLHELPASLLTVRGPNQPNVAKSDMEILIHDKLATLLKDLESLEATAANADATFKLAEMLQPMLARPGDLSAVGRLRLPAGGFEQTVLDNASRGVEALPMQAPRQMAPAGNAVPPTRRQLQRVLADPGLLSRLFYDEDAVPRTSWNQVVLANYRGRLAQTIAETEKLEKSAAAVRRVMARLAAAFSLISLMAIFPFGEAVALPALGVLLEVAGSTAAVLTILIIAHGAFAVLEEFGKLDAKARDLYYRLGQTDPDGLYQLGGLLSESKALQSAVANGGLIFVLTMPIARLRIVAAALTLAGLAQDLEVLFGNRDTSGE